MLRMGMRRLLDLWSAPLEDASSEQLARILAGDKDALRVRAIRTLAARGVIDSLPSLPSLLTDPVPGVRSALGKAFGSAGRARELEEGLGQEPCWTVRVALAMTLERLGREARLEPPEVVTAEGPRVPERALALGLGDGVGERQLHAPGEPMDERRARLLARVPEDLAALEALGAIGHVEDHERLMGLQQVLGKRGSNAWLLALGRSGDPRSVPALLAALGRVAVDPGRGFAHRRLAALGLGRMGLPSLGPELVRAFHREGVEEGRPGAGLGIQYPVRGVLVWAMGECQAPNTIPLLCGLLGDRTGTAQGGLYLPAMGALVKLGPTAAPHLQRVRGPGAEVAARLLSLWE